MSGRRWLATLGAGIATLAIAAAPLLGEGALEPYRAFARTPAARVLLAEARGAMLAYFDAAAADSSAATDSSATPEAWPGPPAGIYVSLARGRATRACVGSMTPVAGTLRETVRTLAVEALRADRRRRPLRRAELDTLAIVIAFAGPPSSVADPMTIAPAREGLLVGGEHGSVAFLPGEARTVAWALREARRIGVLEDPRAATFQRFDVVTIAEPVPARHPAAAAEDEP